MIFSLRVRNHDRLFMDPKVPDPHFVEGILLPDMLDDLAEYGDS